jgi:hypothetical protein
MHFDIKITLKNETTTLPNKHHPTSMHNKETFLFIIQHNDCSTTSFFKKLKFFNKILKYNSKNKK